MLKSLQFWVLSAAGAACVLLALLNMALFAGNQGLQGRLSARGQYIEQSAQLQGLYQQIVRAVASLSVRNKDPKLQAILAKQGLHVTVNSKASAAAAAAPAPEPKAADRRRGVRHHE